MESIASLRNVVKRYTRGREVVEVLRGLNLEVLSGEFLALMGPSGSGRTTVANLIGGLERPTEGEVTVAGQRIDMLSNSQLARWRAHHVGFVLRLCNLTPVLTAEKDVELPLLLTRMSRAQRGRSIATALTLVSMSDHAKRKPTELSGGQQQRVAVARAIVADPTILVCHEPTGDLDRSSAKEILELLQALNRERMKSIVMVTHDERAADYATRVLHVDKGRLIEAESSAAA